MDAPPSGQLAEVASAAACLSEVVWTGPPLAPAPPSIALLEPPLMEEGPCAISDSTSAPQEEEEEDAFLAGTPHLAAAAQRLPAALHAALRLYLGTRTSPEAARDRLEGRLRQGGATAVATMEEMLRRCLAGARPQVDPAPHPPPPPPNTAAPRLHAIAPRPCATAPPSNTIAPRPRATAHRPAAESTLDGLRTRLMCRRQPAGPLPPQPLPRRQRQQRQAEPVPPPRRQRRPAGPLPPQPPPRRRRRHQVDLDASTSEESQEQQQQQQQQEPQQQQQQEPQQQQQQQQPQAEEDFTDLLNRFEAIQARFAATTAAATPPIPTLNFQ